MDSVFTKILKGELPGYVVTRTETAAALLSLEGHPLVVPLYQYTSITELDDEIAAELMQMIVKVSSAVEKVTGCEGINIVQSNGAVAGQEVLHVHFHIKPRFTDDGVVFSWDTNIKPDSERKQLAENLQSLL